MIAIIALINNAHADFDWKNYAIGVGATALTMPITYKTANRLTHTSNKLIPGLIPPLLTGILLPPTFSSISTHYGNNFFNKTNTPIDVSTWGQTVGVNTILFTGAALGKMDITQTSNRLLYSTLSALILPLPTLFYSENKGVKKQNSINFRFQLAPTKNGNMLSGGYCYGTF